MAKPDRESSALLLQSCFRRQIARKEAARRLKLSNKKKNVAREILATEKEYVDSLNTLLEYFLRPLQVQYADQLPASLQKELHSAMFGVEVIHNFHLTFLEEVSAVVNTWSITSKLGAIFSQAGSYLKAYSQYVNHYQTVVQLLASKKGDTELQNLLESLKPSRTGKGIKDYLIMPVQRIPRYQMLVQELLNSTWKEHPDYFDLITAFSRIKNVTEQIENQSADSVSVLKVMELSNVIISSSRDPLKLVVPHRRFISKAEAYLLQNNSSSSVRAFLFNDLLLLAKSRKEKYRIVSKILLTYDTQVQVESTSGVKLPSEIPKGTECLRVANESENARFIILTRQDDWCDVLQSVIQGKRVWLPHHAKEDRSANNKSVIDVSTPRGHSASHEKKRAHFLSDFVSNFVPSKSDGTAQTPREGGIRNISDTRLNLSTSDIPLPESFEGITIRSGSRTTRQRRQRPKAPNPFVSPRSTNAATYRSSVKIPSSVSSSTGWDDFEDDDSSEVEPQLIPASPGSRAIRTMSDHSNSHHRIEAEESFKTRLKFLKRTRKKRSTVDVSGTPLRSSAPLPPNDLTLDLTSLPWNDSGTTKKSARKRLSNFFNTATQSERLPFGSPDFPSSPVNTPPRPAED